MTAVKRKDFQKTALYIHELLLKLSEESECAELRDSLNLALLHMQKYFHSLRQRRRSNPDFGSTSSTFGEGSLRGLSPMTPYQDRPGKFRWRWQSSRRYRDRSRSDSDLEDASAPPTSRRSRSSNQGHHNDNTTNDHYHNHPNEIESPILHAVRYGDLSTIEAICQEDESQMNACDRLGRTALMYCIRYEQIPTLEWLLHHNADQNAVAYDGTTALIIAAYYGIHEAVDLLLKFNANVNSQDSLGRAAIHWAATKETCHCLKSLINYDANVNIRDEDGLSPSMWACRVDNIEHFRLISEVEDQKIDEPDGIERDHFGRTWVHWAVRRTEPLECLSTLLTEGTAALRDDSGKTVMLLAAEMGSLPACRVISDIGGTIFIHDRDDQGRCPLHLATIGGHGEVVNFLLEKGSDLDCRDKNNCTAWTYANNRNLHYCKLIISSHHRQRSRLAESRGSNATSSGGYEVNGDWKPKTPPRPPKTPPKSETLRSPTHRRSIKRPYTSDDFANADQEEDNFVIQYGDENGVNNDNENGTIMESMDAGNEENMRMENDGLSDSHQSTKYARKGSEEMDFNHSNNHQDSSPPVTENNPSSPPVVARKRTHIPSQSRGALTIQDNEQGGTSTQVIPNEETNVLVIHGDDSMPLNDDSPQNSPPVLLSGPGPMSHVPRSLGRSQPPPRIPKNRSQSQKLREGIVIGEDSTSSPFNNNNNFIGNTTTSASLDRVSTRVNSRPRPQLPSDSSIPDEVAIIKPPKTPPEMCRRPAVPQQLMPLDSKTERRQQLQQQQQQNSHQQSIMPPGMMKKSKKKNRRSFGGGGEGNLGGGGVINTTQSWTSDDDTRQPMEEVNQQEFEPRDYMSTHSIRPTARMLNSAATLPTNRSASVSLGPPVLNPKGPGHARQTQLLSSNLSQSLPMEAFQAPAHGPYAVAPVPPPTLSPLDTLRNPTATWNTSGSLMNNSGGAAGLGGGGGDINDLSYSKKSPPNNVSPSSTATTPTTTTTHSLNNNTNNHKRSMGSSGRNGIFPPPVKTTHQQRTATGKTVKIPTTSDDHVSPHQALLHSNNAFHFKN